jgi:hypothetical protein
MTSTLRNAMLAATIFATPFAAFAQSNNPTGNMGSNSSVTATPPTANSPAAAMNTGDVKATAKTPTAMERSPSVPGATGRTVVPGSNSTVAGDHSGTAESKTGQAGGTGGGK